MNNIQIAKGLQAISEGIALIAGAMIEDGAKQTAEQLPLVAQPQAADFTKAVGTEKKPRAKKEKAVEAAAPAQAPVEAEDAFSETPAAAPATVVEAAQSSAPAAPQIDEATLRNKLVEYAQKHGKDKAYSILGKFDGAKKVNELKPELMPKVYNELSAGL